MTTRRLDVLFCTSTDTLCQVCHVPCIECLHVGGKNNPQQVHLFSTSYLHSQGRAEIWVMSPTHFVLIPLHILIKFIYHNLQNIIKTETTHLQKVAYEHKQVPSCYQEHCYHTKAPPNQNTPE